MPQSHSSTRGQRYSGRYQLRPSKAMMNVRRYNVSGTSHNSGTAATFWVRWFVTARSSTDPVAESASHNHKSCFFNDTAAARASVVSGILGVRHATTAHSSAKPAKSHDQSFTCSRAARKGSMTKGYPTSAISEARLEMAKSRYGFSPGRARENHA